MKNNLVPIQQNNIKVFIYDFLRDSYTPLKIYRIPFPLFIVASKIAQFSQE